MKLTIKNIERISGLGDYDSPVITYDVTVYPDRYSLPMHYEGKIWNVVLYRDIHPTHNQYQMSVEMIGKMHFETTAIDRAELNSAGITLSIIESVMNKIIEKLKV
jgi:hypothetical protein